MTGTAGAGSGNGPAGDAESWTVLRLMRWSGAYLEEKGVERGKLDAEHLLAHALGTERLQLYLEFDRPLEAAELDGFRPLLRRRASREPLQYILGRAAFRELDLHVDRRVLIPRPETEELVEAVLEWAREEGGEGLTALDVGTGTGAIALSLALEGPFHHVVGVDNSAEALEVARVNRDESDLGERVDLREGFLFRSVRSGETFDVVVSNPPYVAESEAGDLQPEVGEWEPGGALFGGPDGLDVIRGFVAEVGDHLRCGGLLAVEVGADQTEAVAALVADTGQFEEIRVRRDLAGRPRMVLARRLLRAS